MDQRIKGQEISVRINQDGTTVAAIDTISTFNDEVKLRLLEAGYLGEVVNRFDEILDGYGGDMEINVTQASWITLVLAIEQRARREVINTVFNVVRTDLFPNGDTLVLVYSDVHWGPVPTTVGSRSDYVKVKLTFSCSQRATQQNAVA